MRAWTKEGTVQMKTEVGFKKCLEVAQAGFDNGLVVTGRSWSEYSPQFRRFRG